MDQVFTALDRRQAMLLLTTVAFGGQESLPGLAHLRPEEGALLRHRAEQLLQIPREKRIPLLIHELKRRMSAQRSQLLSADPQALAALLASERQAVAEVVLRALPATLADQVRALLPPITVKLTREVRPDVINSVRWKLEARLAQMASHLPLRFVDVLLLEPRDHYGLCDRLGARALAAAVEGLEPEAKRAFLEGVAPDQRALLEAAMDVVRARPLPHDEAVALIELHQGDGGPSDAVRSAGAQRLARACIAQSPELAARLLEKHRGSFGTAFMHWVRDERTRARPGDGGRTDVLAEMEAMVLEGVAERPVRAPPRKIQSSTPPPPRAAAAASGEPRANTSSREPRASSSASLPARHPSRVGPAAVEPRASVGDAARSPLTAPPRLLSSSSERAVAAPFEAAGADDRHGPGLTAPPRRSLSGEGLQSRAGPTSAEARSRTSTGEGRGVPPRAAGLAGPPRARTPGPQERPSREERVDFERAPREERPSREERVGAVQERPSREERVGGAGFERAPREERPSREERVGAVQERPSREERVGGAGFERAPREERPSREERVGSAGFDRAPREERPSREERVGAVQERPAREERVGALQERPSRVGPIPERPSREERVGAVPDRPAREERVGERRPRDDRPGTPPERHPRPDRPEADPARRMGAGGPAREGRGSPAPRRPSLSDRPAREPRAREAVPGRDPRRGPREAPVGPTGSLPDRAGIEPAPGRPRPGPPVPDGALSSPPARVPGVASPAGGARPSREADPRAKAPRETQGGVRPPRPGSPVPVAADGSARPPKAAAGGARQERPSAAAPRSSGPSPVRRDPAPERVARPAAGAAPDRRAEGARGEGRGPRPAQVPGRPSRKLE